MSTSTDWSPSKALVGDQAMGRRRLSLLQQLIRNRRLLSLAFLVLIAGGLVLHSANVWRPIDASTTSSWRESDLGMIARNFWRSGMNILYPQIDWRRDTPGYVESELPLLSWLMALSYRAFGYHEEFGRVIALAISLATLAAFYRLARRLMPPFQARLAWLFFLFSPIMVEFSTNLQPDPGMLLATICCVNALLAWLKDEKPRDLFLCAVTGALALLLKLPAITIGLAIAAMVIEKFGWRAFRDWRVWALGLTMLVPAALWYGHTHQFWLLYGNSLGISNETHWLGLDLLRAPKALARLIAQMLKTELKLNLGLFGVVLALVGLWRSMTRARVLAWWVGAAFVFYLIALRTTGSAWAYYYHCLSIPPLCLLMGLACAPLRLLRRSHARRGWLVINPTRIMQVATVLTLAMLIHGAWSVAEVLPPRRGGPVLTLRYRAAEFFGPMIPEDALIATVGGPCLGPTGMPVAHDDSALMFWLDRKGFILCDQELTIEGLRQVRSQGARFFISEKADALDRELQRQFHLVARFGECGLYELQDATPKGIPGKSTQTNH